MTTSKLLLLFILSACVYKVNADHLNKQIMNKLQYHIVMFFSKFKLLFVHNECILFDPMNTVCLYLQLMVCRSLQGTVQVVGTVQEHHTSLCLLTPATQPIPLCAPALLVTTQVASAGLAHTVQQVPATQNLAWEVTTVVNMDYLPLKINVHQDTTA